MGIDKFLEILFGTLATERASKFLSQAFSVYILFVILTILFPDSLPQYQQNEVLKLVINSTIVFGIYGFSFTAIIVVGRYFVANAIVSLTKRKNSTKSSIRQLERLISSFITWWIIIKIPILISPIGLLGLIGLLLLSIIRGDIERHNIPNNILPPET